MCVCWDVGILEGEGGLVASALHASSCGSLTPDAELLCSSAPTIQLNTKSCPQKNTEELKVDYTMTRSGGHFREMVRKRER